MKTYEVTEAWMENLAKQAEDLSHELFMNDYKGFESIGILIAGQIAQLIGYAKSARHILTEK